MRHLGVAFLLLPLLTASAPAQDIQVDVQGSGGRLYQVAVQRFAAMDGAFPLREAFFRDLSEAIAFSSVLEPVDHSAFLGPGDTRDLASGIQCGNWKGIGADALVQGQLRTVGLELVARYRVWDTVRCKLQGKVIEARRPREDAQLLARSIADEIVERFTGRRGVSATQIAFVSDQTGSKQVYLMEADGARKRPVTRNGTINLFPAWAADGKSLVYTSYKTGRPEIWTIFRGPQPGAPLLRSPDEQLRAVWSSVPGLGAVVLNRDGNTDIYALRGQSLSRLTSQRSIEVSPTFSPDGRRIAFVSDRTGTPQIYVKELASDDVRRITFRGSYNSNPAWSPTGEWIAYTARTTGGFDLYLVDPDSGFTAPLVLHPRSDEDPAWSPDGRKLAFTSARRGRKEIYRIDVDGRNLVRLTESFGNSVHPAWSGWLE
jgi:TolB protein